MRLTKDFILQEFIHPDIFECVGKRSADFLHPLLAPTIQLLRDKFGKIVINNWQWGGAFVNSGLRVPNGKVGARFSAHKFGCGGDCKFEDIEPIEVQNYIIMHPDKFTAITRLENALVTKTWLHVEAGVRTRSIKVFNP